MPATPELPAAKQTTLGLYVTAKQAYEKWKSDPGTVKIIDVRTPEEFLFVGHPDMAWNVPVVAQTFTWDAQKKHFPMQPLPDFIARAQRVAKPGDTLLVMCRSGGRGAAAVNLLAKAGYKKRLQHHRWNGRRRSEGSRQRFRWPAHDQWLEEFRVAVDVRD